MEFTIESLAPIGTVLATILGAAFTVFKAVIAYIDKRHEAQRTAINEERIKLEKIWADQMLRQADKISKLETEVDNLSKELLRHARHVGRLEGLMAAAGLEVPKMEDADDA